MHNIFCIFFEIKNMSNYLRKWLGISFFNLLIVASLGVILRYKIAFYLPFVDQKHLLHSHSHFAFAGWLTQVLMVLLVHYLTTKTAEKIMQKYNWLLYANCITAYGMLIGFAAQGYGFSSILFSMLSIFVSYIFAILYWRDLNKLAIKNITHSWFKASLVFSLISSIGTFALAYMMANKIMVQHWQLGSIYFYLHFQYNGWFMFACIGLIVSAFEHVAESVKQMKLVFLLFCSACIPAYFLSALWLPFPTFVYYVVIAAVLAQLVGWGIFLQVFFKNKLYIQQQFYKPGKILLILSAIAFSIKLLLQLGSVHPALSQLSYGFRPIVIGYLHLVLLAVTSVFIIGYIVACKLISISQRLLAGIYIFVVGVIINELLLMIQGVQALSYNSFPHINILLLITAVTLFLGIGIMFVSQIKNKLL
jgi:hypothetical protein